MDKMDSKSKNCEDVTDNDSKLSNEETSPLSQQQPSVCLTLNNSDTNLLDNMSEASGTAGNNASRPLSVPPSLTTNQDAVDLVDQVDALIQEVTVNFSAAVKEVYDKRKSSRSSVSPSQLVDFAFGASSVRTAHKLTFTVDDMAARIDAMEARALAAQAAEEAEEAAANKESK